MTEEVGSWDVSTTLNMTEEVGSRDVFPSNPGLNMTEVEFSNETNWYETNKKCGKIVTHNP